MTPAPVALMLTTLLVLRVPQMAETRQSRRPKRPQPSRDDDGSPPRGGGGGSKGGKAAPVRTGKANKKRDDRSALVEAWMLKNENTSEKPTNEVKARYADVREREERGAGQGGRRG